MSDNVILGEIDLGYLLKAANKLQQVLDMPKNEITRDAAIQRFEFTYELVWKTLKKILKVKGIIVNNPRDVFRESAKQGLIVELEVWFKYIEDRNNTTHVYNEQIADDIYSRLPVFSDFVQKLITTCISLK